MPVSFNILVQNKLLSPFATSDVSQLLFCDSKLRVDTVNSHGEYVYCIRHISG